MIHMGVSINGEPPNGWFIYNGKSHSSGRLGGTPISGNPHIHEVGASLKNKNINT